MRRKEGEGEESGADHDITRIPHKNVGHRRLDTKGELAPW